VIREVKEESGLDIKVGGILGIFTDPHHVIAYEDGEVRQEFNITFTGQAVGGMLMISDESTVVRFIALDELERLPLHETIRLRVRCHERPDPFPFIG
jgi:ADP-ribose pyrophosphatase YjhB (NUDIX family)